MAGLTVVQWPELELTDMERQWCDHYATSDKPGVLMRSQMVTLSASTFPGENNVLSALFGSSGRRTRVFALTFSGDTFNWTFRLSAQAGEKMIQDFAAVNALQNVAPTAGAASQKAVVVGTESTLFYQLAGPPLVFDPNIVLEGTQELVLEGTFNPDVLVTDDQSPARTVLNIGLHYWEFPDFPRVLAAPGQPSLSDKVQADEALKRGKASAVGPGLARFRKQQHHAGQPSPSGLAQNRVLKRGL